MKEDEKTCTKVCSTLKKLFIGQDKLDPIINRAIVSCTYFQVNYYFYVKIIESLNIIVLFSIFSKTNSQTFSIVMSALCLFLFLI